MQIHYIKLVSNITNLFKIFSISSFTVRKFMSSWTRQWGIGRPWTARWKVVTSTWQAAVTSTAVTHPVFITTVSVVIWIIMWYICNCGYLKTKDSLSFVKTETLNFLNNTDLQCFHSLFKEWKHCDLFSVPLMDNLLSDFTYKPWLI